MVSLCYNKQRLGKQSSNIVIMIVYMKNSEAADWDEVSLNLPPRCFMPYEIYVLYIMGGVTGLLQTSMF